MIIPAFLNKIMGLDTRVTALEGAGGGGGGGGATDIFVKTSSIFGSTVNAGVAAAGDFSSPDVNVGSHITSDSSSITLAAGLYEVVAYIAAYKGAAAETIKIKADLGANTWDQSSQSEWREILTGDPGNESALRFRSIRFSQIINATTSGSISLALTNNSATQAFNVDAANLRVVRLGAALA